MVEISDEALVKLYPEMYDEANKVWGLIGEEHLKDLLLVAEK